LEWEDSIFMKDYKKRIFFLFFVLYGLALFFFYIKYVPLISLFQVIIIPLLIIIIVLSAVSLKIGIMFFVFAFPLINILPYFFGIYEQTPHAPTALVLFLFFFWGWLLNVLINENSLHFSKSNIIKPMILFSFLLTISGVLTCWKYTNFFPLLSANIYELITNVRGVSAGGAIMSSIFFALNYLTGFAFVIILTSIVDFNRFYIKKILIILLISTSIALAFGFYQHFVNIEFGNTPFRVKQSLINSTFKDPLSFGGYMGAFIPLGLTLGIAFKGFLRFFSVILFVCSAFLIFHSGSKSGLISAIIGLFVAILIIVILGFGRGNEKNISLIKIIKYIIPMIIILGLAGGLIVKNWNIIKDSMGYKRVNRFVSLYNQGGFTKALGIRWTNRWYVASKMARQYPLTGVGIGSSIIELPNYEQMYKLRKMPTDSAENYFLQVLSELGIIGLIISLWMFFEIFKLIFQRLKDPVKEDRWKIIQIGIACGILAIFLQYFVHTYIGSYEIKYTFWLLVGLLIVLGRRDTGEEEAKESKNWKEGQKQFRFSKPYKLIGGALILIFTVVHLWNSTHSLSLANRTKEIGIKQDFGFYQLEKTADGHEFRWTRGYGGTTIKVENPVIEIPLLASHPEIQKKPVKVKIYIVKNFFKEKKLLDEVILNRSIWKEYEYHLPEEVGREVILLFKVSRTWIPLKVLGTPDPRKLGVAVGKIRFRDLKEQRLSSK